MENINGYDDWKLDNNEPEEHDPCTESYTDMARDLADRQYEDNYRCSCKSRLGGGDCHHTMRPEDCYPTHEEMIADGYVLCDVHGYVKPNKFLMSWDEEWECEFTGYKEVTGSYRSYMREDGTDFTIHLVWHSTTGSTWKCECGEEDLCGDINWYTHQCKEKKPRLGYANISSVGYIENDDDIPF